MKDDAVHLPVLGDGVHHLGLVLGMIEMLVLGLAQVPVRQHLAALVMVGGLLLGKGSQREVVFLLV